MLSITPFDDVQTAVDWANASEYGLGHPCGLARSEQAMAIANALELWRHLDQHARDMATEMPHGGMRNSGYGSDLSMQSLLDYTQVKHVMLAHGGQPPGA